MHRSGTSVVTGSLQQTGLFDLGKSLMKPSFDNPDGFFENRRIVDFNDSLLGELGVSWADVLPINNRIEFYEGSGKFFRTLDTIISEEFSSADAILIKDPRLAILFPFWEKYARSRGYDINIVVCMRDALDVAYSLKNRSDFAIDKGLGIWAHYNLSFFEAAADFGDCLLFSYEEYVDAPVDWIERILKRFEVSESLSTENKAEIRDFVRKPRRQNERPFFGDETIRKNCDELYQFVLRERSKSGILSSKKMAEIVESKKGLASKVYEEPESKIRFLFFAGDKNIQEILPVSIGHNRFDLKGKNLEGITEIRVYPSLGYAQFRVISFIAERADGECTNLQPQFSDIFLLGDRLFSFHENASFHVVFETLRPTKIRLVIEYVSTDVSALRQFASHSYAKLDQLTRAQAESMSLEDLVSYIDKKMSDIRSEIVDNMLTPIEAKAQIENMLEALHIRLSSDKLVQKALNEGVRDAKADLEKEIKRSSSQLSRSHSAGISKVEQFFKSRYEELKKEFDEFKHEILELGDKIIGDCVEQISEKTDQTTTKLHENLEQNDLKLREALERHFKKFDAILRDNEKKEIEVQKQWEQLSSDLNQLSDFISLETGKIASNLSDNLADIREQIESAEKRNLEIEKQLDARRTEIADREWEISGLRQDIGDIRSSFTWRIGSLFVVPVAWVLRPFAFVLKIRLVQDMGLGLMLLQREGFPEFIRRGYWYMRGKRLIEEIPLKNEDVSSTEPKIEFQRPAHVDFSIIIPVYNQWKYTEKCLSSICRNDDDSVKFEVILANDCSTDETEFEAKTIPGLRHVKTSGNLGFLRNCNHAARRARGDYLFFLNNDTIVKENWLTTVLDVFRSDPSVGVVGSKLVFSNGRLQEAGGIIFRDATGWNYGRGQDPEAPEYNYLKDVDYCSGAALAVRRDVWKKVGGFDEDLSPAYYEDTDLCFGVRRLGYRTVYQPKSVVIHMEGISHGTSIDSGIKKNQDLNQKKFLKKWKTTLKQHPRNGEEIFRARDRSFGKPVVVFIDHHVPFFDKDAGSRSTFHWVKVFLALGYSVKFIGDNYYRHEPYTSELQNLGVEVLYGYQYQNNWKKWLTANADDIDCVYFHRPHITIKYLDFVIQNLKAKTLYQPHDLHFLRLKRKWEIDGDDESLKQSKNWFQKEKYIAENVDVCLTFSDYELQVLQSDFKCKECASIPLFAYDNLSYEDRDWDFRSGLMFIGGFGHPPNIDGLNWFLEEIFPRVIEKNPDIVLHLIGSNMPRELRMKACKNIKIWGFVTDDELYRIYASIKLVVIPLRYGAGVKGKLIESMKYGVPVVATSVAVEGVPGIEEVIPATDTPDGFADRINALLKDPSAWLGCSMKSIDFIASNYTQKAAIRAIGKVLS